MERREPQTGSSVPAGAASRQRVRGVEQDDARRRTLERDAEFLTVQVVLTGNPEVLFERYRTRGERHPCHVDHDRLSDMHAMLHSPFESLTVTGETHYFDTSSLSDDAIAEMLRRTVAV